MIDEEEVAAVTGVLPVLEVEREDTVRTQRDIRLVCVAGLADLGRSFRIGQTPLVIGRGLTEVQLLANDVSRHHAKLTPSAQDLILEDLRSANGTLLNDSRIVRPTRVRVGDRIQVGTTILVVTLHDELEDRMRQLQRVEAMTAFAGGIAHDFNNTLMVISAGLAAMRQHTGSNPALAEIIGELTEATSDASGLVKRLLRLGRADPITLESVKVRPLVERVVAQLHRVSSSVEVIKNVPEGLRIHGSTVELHQILLNLLINARDAMPQGGRVTIGAYHLRLSAAEAIKEHMTEGAYVRITVQDTGVGMEEAVVARAFEPFFTTKGPGKGTGLGLAMIHQIVRNHGGSVTITSTVGRGTQVAVTLPSG